MQTRALQALQSLAKGKRGGSNLPMQSIQTAFRQGKGLPRLVNLLDRAVTPRSSRSGQGKAIMAGVIDALAAMTRNNAAARQAPQPFPALLFDIACKECSFLMCKHLISTHETTAAMHEVRPCLISGMKMNCRKEAIEAGAVPALCSVLGTGDDEPVSIEVLKALYTIIAPDGTGKLDQAHLILMRHTIPIICDGHSCTVKLAPGSTC